MSKTHRKIKDYPIVTQKEGRDSTHVRLEVFYNKGGINYFTGKTEPRGYWLSALPVKETEHFTSTIPTDGVKQFLEEANRFSQKKLETIDYPENAANQLIRAVAERAGIYKIDGFELEATACQSE